MVDGYIGISHSTVGRRQDHSVTGEGDTAIYRQRTDASIQGINPLSGATEAIWKDAYTGAIAQIDIAHAAIHLGKYFSHSGVVSVLNGASYDHLIITPDVGGKYIHFRLFLFDTTNAPILHQLYEDATVSNNGTVITGLNFNRTLPNATLGVYHTPTVTGTGTIIHTAQVTGSKQNGGAGQTSGTEWILKQGAKYLSRVTNNSGLTASVGYVAEWYEL